MSEQSNHTILPYKERLEKFKLKQERKNKREALKLLPKRPRGRPKKEKPPKIPKPPRVYPPKKQRKDGCIMISPILNIGQFNRLIYKTVDIMMFDRDKTAAVIWNAYKDYEYLLRRELTGYQDDTFHDILVTINYYHDQNIRDRLHIDWIEVLGITICKWLIEVETSYKTKGPGRTGSSLYNFFLHAFARIFQKSYIDYCRLMYKEYVPRLSYAQRYEYLDVDVDEIPSLTNPAIFDNELFYHIQKRMEPLSPIVCS